MDSPTGQYVLTYSVDYPQYTRFSYILLTVATTVLITVELLLFRIFQE